MVNYYASTDSVNYSLDVLSDILTSILDRINFLIGISGTEETDLTTLNTILGDRASEATLLGVEATLSSILADAANLDVSLSTVATEATLLGLKSIVATDATLSDIESTLTILQSILATESTLSAVKTNTDNLDVALSTRATEVTLSAVKTDLDEIALDTDNLALIKAKTDNLDVALSTRATEVTLAAAKTDLDTIASAIGTNDITAPSKVAVVGGVDIIGKAQPLKVSYLHALQVEMDGDSVDVFGRLRVSQPETLFDSKVLYDSQPLYWDDQQTSGSGTTSTFNTNQASVTMAVSASTAGKRVRQTFRSFAYQPGKAQFISMTGVIGIPATGITRRLGYFTDSDGIFFESGPTDVAVVIRSSTNGSPVDTRITQSNWNTDKMDGSGPSGITIDFSKTQIFVMDFQWLGVGTVRFGFYVNRTLFYVHEAHHSNIDTVVYMSVPNLPLRWSIANDGTGGAASLKQICGTVVSEGGREFTGVSLGIPRMSALVTNNDANFYPLIAFRLQSGRRGVDIRIASLTVVCTSNVNFAWELILNPVVTGTAFSFSGLSNSNLEADLDRTNTTTVSGGTILAAGIWSEANAASSGLFITDPTDVQLGMNIAGTADIAVLAVSRLPGGGAETFYGSVSVRETT